MVLPYSKTYPWNDNLPTAFANKIIAPYVDQFKDYTPKIHTIREGDRWKAGNSIQMAYGVRTKDYFQFNYEVKETQVCKSTQRIIINPNLQRAKTESIGLNNLLGTFIPFPDICIDGRLLQQDEILKFITNDGFDSMLSFMFWFNKPFSGQLIHWTDLKY